MTVPGMQESWLENGQQGPLLTRVPIGGNLGSPSHCKSLSVEFDWQEKIPYACLLVRILKMSPCMEYKDKTDAMFSKKKYARNNNFHFKSFWIIIKPAANLCICLNIHFNVWFTILNVCSN